MKTSIFALLIGAFGGMIAALCGVGGGIIMVPAFRQFLVLDQKQSIATSLVVIVPTALVASLRHLSSDVPLIDWKIAVPAAIGATAVAFFATGWMKSLSNDTLTRVFAVVMILAGLKLLLDGRGA